MLIELCESRQFTVVPILLHVLPGTKRTAYFPPTSPGRGTDANFLTVSAFHFFGWSSLSFYKLTLLILKILALNSIYLLAYIKDEYF